MSKQPDPQTTLRPPNEKVQKLAERLRGTCDNATDEIEELSVEECKQLDHLVFHCSGCGWWFDKNECNELGDWFCDECAKEIAVEKPEETSRD